MLKDKNIIVGVTAGIAAYKAVDLVSRLKKQNANVEVIMTENATKFVSPLTFQTLALNPVYVDMFKEPRNYDVEHISLAEKADVFLIAPATANIIGKIANGIADDLLTTTIMATKAKVIFAPAMNTNMYLNPIVQGNMDYLKGLGYEFIKPGIGILACQTYGPGRMAESADIVEYVIDSFYDKDLVGRKILVTAGPTIEPLDPVRYITNHSSGKMGYKIAEEANKRGADVVLISGPTNLEPPTGVEIIKVNTTREMFNAVEEHFYQCEVLIKAAAPLDYRPEVVSNEKIKKKDGEKDELNIKYIRNPDIVAHFGNLKKNQIVVGFAAETNNLIEHAKEKLAKKNLDFIVANDVSKDGAGFKTDTNLVTIIDKDGMVTDYPILDKLQVAKIILNKVKELINDKS
ncbi:fused 4'-phosphopantothenoylcysteine decarboxylase; phosphopantothenoylcysteine synthetase,FMN-binding [[Clostridium] ultunense Esp]|uniref:Coenzyme A biosynthesis bifunctional protein CoaBC n=1 Tax=[Clostridium] ultunense Esp TaxID=1288971 RepID=M1ZDP2_9FIRM|nr:bifunctional phosphopantothenoylcysteine decarboxylase/phosphopantothenate--cysteine ligase CoaBC [Schnuerera ultunensis]CCQ96053.1 fused 4'-phosphopantothenoylcysteine decarboxylase; phosphopantothenoylcysteine synthetase,FMN-binding [[Clostridium] ultunense Esp]SHD76946.1 coenzyme A biosynthesis bifunctional protein CoaBC; phosphopantothenoylcysteine synthetase/decarboxylase [[Clostridium] ultunense Esp]